MTRSLKDFAAGLIFVALGLAFAATAFTYELGTAFRMGPGYFPLVLGAVLVVLGVGIVIEGALAGEGGAIGPIPWRGLLLILPAILFFGFCVRGLGLAPTLFVTVLAAALASARTTPLAAVLIAIGLTAACLVIFVAALGLNLPLFGPWVRG